MDVKRQHYVPRELLRNFSSDNEKKSINIFCLKDDLIKQKARLYTQAHELYFYGKDQRLEKAYSIIDSNFSSALKKLNNGDTKLSKEEDAAVRLFIVFQLHRTPGSIDYENDFLTQFMKKIFKKRIIKNETDIKYFDNIKFEFTQPQDFLFAKAYDINYMVSDLRISLIENVDETFVIGQNPVCILNPFLYEINYKNGLSGLGEKGAIVLMPISPKYLVVLYDSYPYIFNRKNNVIIPSKHDIDSLNYCQFLKTKDCIYFKNGILEKFKKLNKKSEEFRNGEKAYSEIIDVPKGEKGYIIRTSYKDFPFPQIFDCIKIKERAFMVKMDPFFDVERPIIGDMRIRRGKRRKINKENEP